MTATCKSSACSGPPTTCRYDTVPIFGRFFTGATLRPLGESHGVMRFDVVYMGGSERDFYKCSDGTTVVYPNCNTIPGMCGACASGSCTATTQPCTTSFELPVASLRSRKTELSIMRDKEECGGSFDHGFTARVHYDVVLHLID